MVECFSRTVTNSKRGATLTRRLALAFALLWRMIVGGGRSALSPPCFGNGSARLGVMDYPGRHHSTAVFPSAVQMNSLNVLASERTAFNSVFMETAPSGESVPISPTRLINFPGSI